MAGAGFIGVSATRRHRRSGTTGSFAVTLTGLTGSGAQDGTVLGFSDNGAANPTAQRWQTSVDGGVWVDLPGAGGATLAIDLAGGAQSDTHLIRVGVTIDGLEKFSNTAPLRHAAPLATGALAARDLTLGTGVITAATAGAFTGLALSYAVSPETIPGVSIDSATGVISLDTDVMSPQSGTVVQVTATNSGGSAQSGFVLEAAAPVTYSAQITGLTDNPTYGPTAQIGISLIGVIPELLGTETVVHRWTDSGGVIGGATTPLYTPTADRDLGVVRYRPLVNGAELTSPAQIVRHAPPVAGSLAPVNEMQGTGSPVINLAAGFSGEALSYAETVGWAAISGDTLTINDALRDETLTITATNSGGTAEVGLSVRIMQAVDTDFILTLETTEANETFTLPLRNAGSYDATLEWGDGASSTITSFDDPDLTHSYATPGTHTLRMRGTAAGIFFNNRGDRLKVRTVESMGNLGWTRMDASFWGCANMISFTTGNMGGAKPINFFATFRDCTSLTTCDVTGLDTSQGTSAVAMFAGCTSLTAVDVTGFDTANMETMAEMFFQCPAITSNGLDFSGFDVSGLTSTQGLADFATGFAIPATVWDAALINWASQTVLSGVKLTATGAVFTPGGAAEAARTSLINDDGWIIDDVAGAVPGAMGAPTLTVVDDTSISVVLGTDPVDTGGYPIIRREIRYRIGLGAWTEVSDVTSPVLVTGLTPDTTYEFANRAVNVIGGAGWGGNTTNATTDAAAAIFGVENVSEEPVITTDGSGNISFTIAAGVYAGTYTTRATDSATLTQAMVEAAATCVVLPTVAGSTGDGETLTITPGLWLYAGDDPGDQSWVQKLDGTANGETDLDYVIQTADVGADFTVDETFGGVTVTSAATELDGAAAGVSIATDAGGKVWYSPSNITVDGSNNVTNWPDNVTGASGDYDLDSVPTSVTAPLWDAGAGKATFDGSQSLVSSVDFTNLMSAEVETGGETLILFAVVELKTNNPATKQAFFAMCETASPFQAFSMGYTSTGQGASDTNVEIALYAQDTTQAFGNNFTGLNTVTGNVAIGKRLMEVHVAPGQVDYYVDGVLQYTDTYTTANLPDSATSRMVMGGRANATSIDRAAAFDMYEFYMTTNTTDAAAFRTELQTRHGL